MRPNHNYPCLRITQVSCFILILASIQGEEDLISNTVYYCQRIWNQSIRGSGSLTLSLYEEKKIWNRNTVYYFQSQYEEKRIWNCNTVYYFQSLYKEQRIWSRNTILFLESFRGEEDLEEASRPQQYRHVDPDCLVISTLVIYYSCTAYAVGSKCIF